MNNGPFINATFWFCFWFPSPDHIIVGMCEHVGGWEVGPGGGGIGGGAHWP